MRNEQVIFFDAQCPVHIHDRSKAGKIGQICEMHFHTEIEFLYVCKGCMICYTDNEKFVIHEGEIIFINSRIPHYTEIAEDGTTDILLQFRDPSTPTGVMYNLSKFLRDSQVSGYIFEKNDPDTDELKGYIDKMLREMNEKKDAYVYYITANMYMVVALLHRKKLLPEDDNLINKKLIEKIMPVVEYIDENYAERISLSQLSDILNLNEYYFCRLFKKATGSTVTDYLNFVRVCKAEKLLKSDMSVSEVSYNAGFSSLSYFNRIFKKYKSCSPSEYKHISSQIDRFIQE